VAARTGSGSNSAATLDTMSVDPDQLTSPGSTLGTVSYMSPEQVLGKGLDARTDLFSFGIVLYEMATGFLPFKGDSSGAVFNEILNREPVPPVRLNTRVSQELEHVIHKGMEKDRELRYQSAAEMRADLRRLKRNSESSKQQASISQELKAKPDRSVLRTATLLLASAVLVVLAAFAYLRWRHRPEFPSLTPVQFTALPGWAAFPAFSPDGTRIAFIWNEGLDITAKGVNIFVKPIGSENLQRLTNHLSLHGPPAWSPDGKQIAYQRLSKDENAIYVIPAQGGAEKKVRSTHVSLGLPMVIDWSPDGKSIAFADSAAAGGHPKLQILSMETLKSKQIEQDDQCVEEMIPRFSHDNKQLAYACFPASSDFGISVATSDGVAPRLIKKFTGYLLGMAWMSDNKRLLFSSSKTGDARSQLHVLAIADGSVQDLPFGAGAERLTVASYGDRLAYDVELGVNSEVFRVDLLHPQAPAVNLISSTRDQAWPNYSPDGKHILFWSDRGGTQEIWMSDSDGTNLVQLTNLKVTGVPGWSPDSSKIVFDSRSATAEGKSRADLYIVDIVERVPRKLLTRTPEASVPYWSHDGKWIYFLGGSDDARGERIYRVPPQGGQAEVLTSSPGYLPQESFDGQSLYFAVHNGSATTLQVASLNPTGTEFRVEGLPPLYFSACWTITRDGIYFFPADDFKTLSYYDFATKKVRPVFKIDGYPSFGVSVSPDGRYLLFPHMKEGRSDIMLINNFH